MKKKTANPTTSITTPSKKKLKAVEYKGDLLIRDLWQDGTDGFHDMCVVNTNYKYHSAKTPEKCLQEAEWDENKMYLEACFQ